MYARVQIRSTGLTAASADIRLIKLQIVYPLVVGASTVQVKNSAMHQIAPGVSTGLSQATKNQCAGALKIQLCHGTYLKILIGISCSIVDIVDIALR